MDILNVLSSHSKLNSSAPSQRLSLAACAASSTSGKLNLSGSQQPPGSIGLNLNINSSDSSSTSSQPNNNNSHSHHHSHSLNSFHHQQYQQQQQQQQQQQHQLNAGIGGNQQVESIEANKGYTFEEQFKQLYELSDDPKRKEFLDDLFQFMADRNQPVNRIPIMAKQVLDLYELYNLVVARGGLVEVINKKIWREITKGLNLPSSITSAAFTLRTQYMKYLYPYECAKNNFSHQDELQQAIDGNRREGRRAGGNSLSGYAPYQLAPGGGPAEPGQQLGGQYSASPSPNHLFAGHNLIVGGQQAHAAHQHGKQQALHLNQDPRDLQRPQSSSSSLASPSASQQRLYQDSIESDHEDDGSIDLGHSSKRNSPIEHEPQHLDPHNHHLSQQQATAEQQQQLAAAAAAAIRQQLGAAINFAGTQSFLGQLSGHATQNGNPISTPSVPNVPNANPNPTIPPATNPNANANQSELYKQQQEQFLAALMAAANQQQQPGATQDQQAASRAALSMVASNAMLIAASSAPDAMAVAAAAQAIGVKGAFIILIL